MNRFSNIYKLLIKILISLVILIIIFNKIDFLSFVKTFKSVNLLLVIISFLLTIFAWQINTIKWSLLIKPFNLSISHNRLFNLNLISLFYSLFLPGQVSGDIVKAYRLASEYKENVFPILLSTFMDKITGLFAIVIMALISIIITKIPIHHNVIFMSILFSNLLIFFLLFIFINPNMLTFVLEKLNFILERYKQRKNQYFEISLVYSQNKLIVIKSIILALFFQLIASIIIFIIALSVKIKIDFSTIVLLFSVVSFLQILPISIAGIGIRDGVFVYFMGLYGVQMVQSLSVSIIFLGISIIIGLIGGILEFNYQIIKSANVNKLR
ncbi:MAG: lysylphosphatidylglycerol synthase transmembrane domain-containing protein [Carboxydocellales bacterium]